MRYKELLKSNTDIIRKFVVNLITMSIFGIFITLPVSALVQKQKAGPVFTVIASLFSVFFFMFVTHDAFWQIGARNAIREKAKKGKADGYTGFKCIIVAYSPVIFFTLFTIALRIINQLTEIQVFAQIYLWLVFIINILFHGMYLGLFNEVFNMNVYSYLLFLVVTVTLPSLSYYLGTKEIKLRSFIGLGDLNFGNKNDK